MADVTLCVCNRTAGRMQKPGRGRCPKPPFLGPHQGHAQSPAEMVLGGGGAGPELQPLTVRALGGL